jgi:hypothetical protein
MMLIPVWLRQPESDLFRVTALGIPDCDVVGQTAQVALDRLRQCLTIKLSSTDFELELIQSADPHHPWLEVAGMFVDDPQFDEVIEFMAADRQALDARMAAYEQTRDASNSAA